MKNMNLPNKLTMLRVIMVPFFVFFLLQADTFGTWSRILALIIFIAASLTDMLDGKIARKYNLITNFGKFMDPLADKLLVCSCMICYAALPEYDFPVWVVLIIIGREFFISGFRLLAAEQGLVIAAGIWGKIKTALTMVTLIIMMPIIPGTGMRVFEQILIYASLAFTIISMVDYVVNNKDVLAGDI